MLIVDSNIYKMANNQATFGDFYSIALSKKRTSRRKNTWGKGLPEVNAKEFSVCETCSKVVQIGDVLPIHIMFSKICDECKLRFCDMANKELLIGVLVKIIK